MNYDSLWFRAQDWPRDQAEYVFLFRALQAVGKSRYGEDWSGKEFSTKAVVDLPFYIDAHLPKNRLYREHAYKMLADEAVNHVTNVKGATLPPSLNSMRPGSTTYELQFTKAGWELARSKIAAINVHLRPIVERRIEVVRNFTEAATNGLVVTAARPKDRHMLSLIDPAIWSVLNLNHVTTNGEFDPNNPGTYTYSGSKFSWIFAERASLARYMVSLADSIRVISNEKYTASDERRAKDLASILLKSRPDMSKSDVLAAITAAGIAISCVGFNQRIWPAAREMAGLPTKAPPGRKRRTSDEAGP
ncbi:hypothetical protein [Methylobacterium nonmethylotrophicum]|uniref:Uncharacterized protein n=1 Tax=Methylobacterium nonmethylotrophicum TaxID=1141884 RepID=A0A4Z0NE37_9HYPH|nr:hypothetical protein [Methylobacterium nonmethylotrophicum]TGD92629.1 hypothetical protein EU555_34405 [Methylobacterium nonmethylotrophicum]